MRLRNETLLEQYRRKESDKHFQAFSDYLDLCDNFRDKWLEDIRKADQVSEEESNELHDRQEVDNGIAVTFTFALLIVFLFFLVAANSF